ncbi:MAG: hypothetical protein M0T81_01180 [Thermoplasmatales archaeon]|nr:hypothetical protein [Thermoplasmatales archaeon]
MKISESPDIVSDDPEIRGQVPDLVIPHPAIQVAGMSQTTGIPLPVSS